jgi:hypothetical protein
MDGIGFDRWVRDLHTRRGVLGALAGIGATLGMTRPVGAVAECAAPGSGCDPANAADCCSGICKKHKHKHKCAPVGSAQGCTKALDGCRTGADNPCPGNPGAGTCIGGQKSAPLCVDRIVCAPCKTDADCVGVGALGPTARCRKGCAFCQELAGVDTVCVEPVAPPI